MRYLNLEGNGLQGMAQDALKGTENSLVELLLSGNKLNQIPTTVGTLRSIEALEIHDNPIYNISSIVVSNLSNILYFISLGSKEMTAWPYALRLIKGIGNIQLQNAYIETIPEDAFVGLENSMNLIEFVGCQLTSIPVALSSLKNLDWVKFDSNPRLDLAGIPREAFNGLNISFLTIRNSSWVTLPDMFLLSQVRRIDTSLTPLEYIDESLIRNDNVIEEVQFSETKFTQIPHAISKMKNLQSLHMNDKTIKRVDSTTFSGLRNLTTIAITNCPLSFIATDAFVDNVEMSDMFLDHTNLTTIPRAIEGRIKLEFISFVGNKLICSCDSLGWMKNIITQQWFYPNGECSNLQNKQLISYILDDVPKCP